MAGFTSRDDIITEVTTNGKQFGINFFKIAARASEAAGVWATLWDGTGTPGAGSQPATTPGTVYVVDAVGTNGSIWMPDVSTDQKFLTSFGAVANQNCTLMLFDYLAGVSGLAIGTTGSKTVSSGALDRYSGTAATQNQVWLQVTTASTAAGSMTCDSYVAGDGTTVSGTAIALPATATDIGTMVQMPLNAAKQGVRSVSTINVGTAATTAVATLMIIHPLAYIPLLANQWNEVSFLDDTMGLPRIYDNANLAMAFLGGAAITPTVWGQINIAYG